MSPIVLLSQDGVAQTRRAEINKKYRDRPDQKQVSQTTRVATERTNPPQQQQQQQNCPQNAFVSSQVSQ
jgi:hypothetical protein